MDLYNEHAIFTRFRNLVPPVQIIRARNVNAKRYDFVM